MVQENLQEKVLKKIKPTLEETRAKNALASFFIKEIQKEGYEAMLVGSLSRGTSLADEGDADIFVFFPPTTPREDLEKKGVELGKKILKAYGPSTHYAEHPYVKAEVEGMNVEIVPCYKIKDKLISAVDRSPLHNEYVKKKMTEKQKDEVLLLKKFLKANGLYGADQKTKGFSGYLCELLIINYGTFEALLKDAAEKWNKKIFIDIEKIGAIDHFKDALIVIDPVDKDRNVASAVSRETLSLFIMKARDYIARPSEEFFFPKEKRLNIKEMTKGRRMVIVSFGCPNAVPEVLWSQLEKLAKDIKEALYASEFETYKYEYWTDEKTRCAIAFELNTNELGKYKRHKGPEVWDAEHCKAFIEKNPMWWVQRSVLYAWKERKFKKAHEVIEDFLDNSELVPSHFKSVVRKRKIRFAEKAHKEPELMSRFFS
ncbi:MAG: CCA tRNA nucleotidyltransferase [archaeon]